MTGPTHQRAAKKALIVEAAATVFARKGFAGTLMADIAEAAGIGKGTLYEYFRSKDELFFAVFEWFVHKNEQNATASIDIWGKTVTEKLVLLSDALMGSTLELKAQYTLIMEFWSASASSNMRQSFKDAFQVLYRRFRAIVEGLLQEGVTRGEFRHDLPLPSIAASLVGMWDALILQAWFEEGFDAVQTARDFIGSLINGLRALE